MALTDEQIERYSRHIILKEVGAKGQKKLLNAKVLIIGAGGLGAPAAMYLGAAGVGTIGIADADEVDLSNLQRQIIHQTADVGKAKVQSAKETINAMNPDVEVRTYREFITSENIINNKCKLCFGELFMKADCQHKKHQDKRYNIYRHKKIEHTSFPFVKVFLTLLPYYSGMPDAFPLILFCK